MNPKVKKGLIITATLIAVLSFLTYHPVSFAHANPVPLSVIGFGEVNGCLIELFYYEQIGTGRLICLDKPSNKMVFGDITSITRESSSLVTISGSYLTVDNISHAFQASSEDLGNPGKGLDKFSITLSDGYTKSGNLDQGEIEISY